VSNRYVQDALIKVTRKLVIRRSKADEPGIIIEQNNEYNSFLCAPDIGGGIYE